MMIMTASGSSPPWGKSGSPQPGTRVVDYPDQSEHRENFLTVVGDGVNAAKQCGFERNELGDRRVTHMTPAAFFNRRLQPLLQRTMKVRFAGMPDETVGQKIRHYKLL